MAHVGVSETSKYACYVGRIGTLAAALGIGLAVMSGPAPAAATTDSDTGTTSSADGTGGDANTGKPTDPTKTEPAKTDPTESEPDPAETESSHSQTPPESADDPDATTDPEPPEPSTEETTESAPTSENPRPTEQPVHTPASETPSPTPDPQPSAAPSAGRGTAEPAAAAPEPDPIVRPTARLLTVRTPEDEPAAITVSATTSTANVPTATVEVTSVTPAEVVTPPSPIHTFVVAVLDFFGYNPEATPDPANPPNPLLAMVWAVYRRIESAFDNATPTVGSATVMSTSLTADGRLMVTGVLAADDADGDTLHFTAAGAQHGTVTVADDGTFTYVTPPTGFGGTDSFTISVDDGTGHLHGLAGLFTPGGLHSRTATISLSIPNTAPQVTGSTGPHDNADGSVTGSVTLTDPDGNALSWSADPSSRGTVSVTISSINATTSQLDYSYVPTAAARHDAAGTGPTTDSLNVVITDGRGGMLTLPLTLDIAPINGTPSSTGNVVVGTPGVDGVVTGELGISDPDNDALSGEKTTGKGTLVVHADGTFTYTPTAEARANAGEPGGDTDALTVTVTDGHGGSIDVAVTVPIAALAVVNHAPVVGTPAYTITGVDTLTGAVHGQVHVSDADSNPLSYMVSVEARYGSVVVAADGSFVYQPSMASRLAPNLIDHDAFTIAVSDGTNPAVSVSVVAVPVTHTTLEVAGTYGVVDDSGGHVLVLSQDGTRLFVTNPSHGSVKVINADAAGAGLGTILVTIPVANPTALTVSPDGKKLYVAGQGASTAYIATIDIDESSPTAYSVTATTDVPLPGYHVSDLAIANDGTRLYATAYTITDSVATGPIPTDGILLTLPLTAGYIHIDYQIPAGTINDQYDASYHASQPTSVAVGHDDLGGTVYVTDPARGTITTYNPAGFQLTSISSTLMPIGVAIGAGTDVWVISNTSGQPLLELNATNTGYTQLGYLGTGARASATTSADGTLALFSGYNWDGHGNVPLSNYNNTLYLVDVDTPNAGDIGRNVGSGLPVITLPTTADQLNTAILTSTTGTIYLTSKNTLTILVPSAVTIPAGPYAPAPGYTLTGTEPTTGTVTGHLDVTDLTGAEVTYTTKTGPSTGTVTLDENTGAFTYTPTAEARTAAGTTNTTPGPQNGTFTITATSAGQTLDITITTPISPTATPPVIGTPAFTLDPITDTNNATQTGTIHATSATRTLTYDLSTAPQYGDLTINPDGTFTYAPTKTARDNAATGGPTADTATLTLSDGLNPPVTITVTNLTITPTPPAAANHAPVVGTPAFTVSGVDALTGAIHGQLNVTDADSDTLSYNVSAAPGRGSVVVNADGSFVYTPSMASRLVAAAGTLDGFTVSVSDGTAAPVTVAVNGLMITKTTLVNAGDFAIVNDTDHWLAVSADGKRLYVTNPTTGSVKIVNADAADSGLGNIIATIPIQNPTAVTVAPDGKHIYVAATSTTMPGYPGRTATYIATIDVDESSGTYGATVGTQVFAIDYIITAMTQSADGTRLYAAGYRRVGAASVSNQSIPTTTPTNGEVFTISAANTGPVTAATLTASGHDTPSYPASITVANNGTVWVSDQLTQKVTTLSATGVVMGTTTLPGNGGATTVLTGLDDNVYAISPNIGNGIFTLSTPGTYVQGGTAEFVGKYAANPVDHTLLYIKYSDGLRVIDMDVHNAMDPGRMVGGTVATFDMDNVGRTVTAPNGVIYVISGNAKLTILVPALIDVSPGPHAGSPGYTLTGTDTGTGRVTGGVTAWDATGATVTYELSGDPSHGSVTLVTATGAFTYSPSTEARTAAGTTNATPGPQNDTFTVTATSSGIAIDITVTTPISPTAAPPVVGTPAYSLGAADTTTGIQTGAIHATSATRTLTYTVSTNPTNGDLAVNSDGTFSYTAHQAARDALAAGTGTAVDNAVITISDGLNAPVTVTVTNLTITPTPPTNPTTNHPPTVGTPAYTITNVDALTGAVHGTIDVTDQDATDMLSYSIIGNPLRGTVVVDADGGFVYTPSTASRLVPTAGTTDGFTVSVTDGTNPAVEVTVTDITITKTTLTDLGDFTITADTGHWLAVSPDGTRLYVTNTMTGSVKVINADVTDPGLGTILVTIPVDNPTAVVVAPDGKHIYVAGTSTNLPGYGGINSAYVATIDVDDASPTADTVVNISPNLGQGYELSSLALSADGAYLYAVGYKRTDTTTFTDGRLFTIATGNGNIATTALVASGVSSRPTSVTVTDDGTVWVTDPLTRKVTTVSRTGGALLSTTTFGASPIYALTVLPGLGNSVWAFSPNTGQSIIHISTPGSWSQLGLNDFSSGYATAPGDHTLIYLSDSSELKLIDVDAPNAGDPGRSIGDVVATYSLPGTFTQAVTAPNGAIYLITGNNRLTIFAPQPVTV